MAERERIARELHDTLLQSLFGLTLRFHTAASRLPADDPAREALDEALKQSDRVMQEGRERVLNLRSRRIDSTNLADALAETGNQLRTIHPANFEISVEGRPRPLDEIVQEEVLLIGREALTNAFTHSGAQNIVAEISYQPGALHVRVRDNGRGIDEGVLKTGYRKGHWGLPGMRERAGQNAWRIARSLLQRGRDTDRSAGSGEPRLPPREPKGLWPWSLFRRRRTQKADFATD